MVTRRRFMQGALGSAMLAAMGPRLAFANVDTERRFVFIFLRGGMDGLSAVPPYGEGRLPGLRGVLMDGMPGTGGKAMRKLDGLFALNPDLPNLHEMFEKRQALVVHAVASPYRERSHFDAQDVMENGSATKAVRSGWLNRAVGELPASYRVGRDDVALGLGPTLPLLLRGEHAVGSWSPPTLPGVDGDTMDRIADLYADYELFATALSKARAAGEMASSMGEMDMQGMGSGNSSFFTEMAQVAAQFLKEDTGPRIATLDFGNWDSHAGQNERVDAPPERFEGRFAELYKGLDRGLKILEDGLGKDNWAKTVVMCVTEFGRTVRINGTLGTDHGTAGAMFIAGGAVDGGRVITDWPGLAPGDLYENRDLRPTMDSRGVFKGILHEHLGIAEASLEDRVFPGTRKVEALSGLIRQQA